MHLISIPKSYRWNMRSLGKIFCISLISMGLFTAQLPAQNAASAAGQLWQKAQAAFGSGNYAGAAGFIRQIIQLASTTPESMHWLDSTEVKPLLPTQQWLEPFFYMLGAAYFNAKDWPNAIQALTKYRQLFPKSTRMADVMFSLGQADLLSGDATGAIPLFTALLPNDGYHVKALLLLVQATKKAGKPEDAIKLIEQEKLRPNLSPDYAAKLNMLLFPLDIDTGSLDKAAAVMQQLDTDVIHVQDVTVFNTLLIRLGDTLLSKHDIAGALNSYRRVRDNAQVIALQKQQIVNLQQQRVANLRRIQAEPLYSAQLQADNNDIDKQIARDQQILVQYQTLAPILPPLFLRIARAYTTDQAFWESVVVYREILRRYPTCAEAEAALYGSILIFDKLKQTDRGLALCQTYLTQYPKGKYADSVGFVRGALAYDAEDFDTALTYFQDTIKNQPDNPRREQIEIILGDINLRELKFDQAIACYQKYEKDYPKGRMLETAQYHSALALLFNNKFEEAENAINAYLQKYPLVPQTAATADTTGFGQKAAAAQGMYVPDAEYRLAMIKFAAGKDYYDEVIKDCTAWLKKYQNVPPRAEVISLMGDTYASQMKNDLAVDAYIRSYKAFLAYTDKDKASQSPEVLDYSLTAAAKLLFKQNKWVALIKMFQEFVQNNPDSPTVVSAVSWIGRADVKLGKVDEAKQYMADTAKQYLNDPSREGVDEIILQLAQLYARKHWSVPVAPVTATDATASTAASATASAATSGQKIFTTASTAPSATTPIPAAEPSAVASTVTTSSSPPADSDPAKDLEDILTIPNINSKPTAQSRILYGQAELARLQRKPQVYAQILSDIAKQFKPEDLSSVVLGEVGDYLVQAGRETEAVPFYNQLMDAYDDSSVVDFAYNGLGQIAYDQKDYLRANKFYSKALDKGLAASKLKQITLGEAQTLLALKRPADAKPLFEEVAGNRAWRGEATALSVYSLGEIQMDLADLSTDPKKTQDFYAAANAFFQRVFVAYQKYPAIQAKAYLKSGEVFEKLGMIPEAIRTYKEMTDPAKNPNLESFPEIADAKQRLGTLAQK